MKLIKSVVEKLELTEKGQVFYWDDELAGFGMYVGTKSPTSLRVLQVNGRLFIATAKDATSYVEACKV